MTTETKNIAEQMSDRLTFFGELWDNSPNVRNWVYRDIMEYSLRMILSRILDSLNWQIEHPAYGAGIRADEARAQYAEADRSYRNDEISGNKLRAATNRAFNAQAKLDVLQSMLDEFRAAHDAEFDKWKPRPIEEQASTKETLDRADLKDINAKRKAMGMEELTISRGRKTKGTGEAA